jgi:hypothetical protein
LVLFVLGAVIPLSVGWFFSVLGLALTLGTPLNFTRNTGLENVKP